MRVTDSPCPNCGASIILLSGEYEGYPLKTKWKLTWQCASCHSHEERTFSNYKRFSKALKRIEKQGQSVLEKHRQVREEQWQEQERLEQEQHQQIEIQFLVLGEGLCPKCHLKEVDLDTSGQYTVWKCTSCGATGKVSSEQLKKKPCGGRTIYIYIC